jgi:hypothetical protein
MKKHFPSLSLALGLLLLFVTPACTQDGKTWGNGVAGEGASTERTLQLSDISGIELAVNADVYLSQGATQSVKAVGQANILDLLNTEVSSGAWKIKFTKSVSKHEKVKLYITVKNLNQASVSGSGSIVGQTKFTGVGDLKVAISGSGDVTLDVAAKSVSTSISGSGDVKLAGQADNHEIAIAGSGEVEANSLAASKVSVRISGSGDCMVNATETLDVSIAGSGDVVYSGSPRLQSKVSGSGDVRSKS